MSGPKPKKAHPNPTPKKKATTHPTPNSITEENPAALAIPWRVGLETQETRLGAPKKPGNTGVTDETKRHSRGRRGGIPVRYPAKNDATRGEDIPVRYVVARFWLLGGLKGLPGRFDGVGSARFGGSAVLLGHVA
jgi:hypothetical protein